MPINTKVTVARRPEGMPVLEDFEVVQEEVPESAPEGHILVRTDTLSVDAFIRTTLDQAGLHDMSPLGAPVTALGVGEVMASGSDRFNVGDWVTGPILAQTHAVMPAEMFQPIAPSSNIPPSTYLGVLGLTTGITAWVGLVTVGEVKESDTVVVSGAAGAVGSVVGQLAKARGARVIGIAGGAAKCAFLTDTLGLDGAIDYKNDDIDASLKTLAPQGVDLFFDNVGGELLDTLLDNLAMEGRVVLCGAISQYQNLDDVRGPKLYLRIAERNGSMRGFTVDHYPQVFEAAGEELARLYTEGRMQLPEHEVRGVENFPQALLTLFDGGHMGKMVVRP